MTCVDNSFTVLLADDDENDIFLIRRTIKRISPSARLLVLKDGDLVLACLQGEGRFADRAAWPLPRILVLDQWMPKLSGLEVLSWLRGQERFANLPVVLLSGGVSPAQEEHIEKLKAAACAKAIVPSRMAEEFERAMRLALTLAWDAPVPETATVSISADVPWPVLRQRNECSRASL
jgi:CheY-like chemotaxis protein